MDADRLISVLTFPLPDEGFRVYARSAPVPKLKNGALNDLHPLAHLGGRHIDAPEPVAFPAMFSCMFF